MVLEAAKGTDVQLYVSTFYQEGGNPTFDEGIKNYINTACRRSGRPTAETTPSPRCHRHGL
ncbi:MAG: hypothetical protein ACLR0P_03330 [Oscillospiraceae bacterium]